MKIIHQCKLKHVQFILAAGDLFDAEVEAIVNSEQTDFVLSKNLQSVSGQIWKRYGEAVQRELDATTQGQVLRAGTVIDTSGGQDFKRIFHAGFHDPEDWLNQSEEALPIVDSSSGSRDSQETEYFAAIGSCITQVLDAAVTQGLKSIAFPLIGCGLFGLQEKMLILQFIDAIEELDDRLNEGESLTVWLVIRDRTQFESAAGVFLDLLMQARYKLVSVRFKPTGMPPLDRFAARLSERSNEDWAKWLVCRYAEIGVELMCYGLGRAALPASTPETLFEEGRAPTFGVLRDVAYNLAMSSPINCSTWGARFFTNIIKDKGAGRALATVIEQRNHLAHGRKSLPLAKIKKLVIEALQLDLWQQIPAADGRIQLADWRPWIGTRIAGVDQIGLFERWQKNARRYLIPETGEVFSLPAA
jgi:O-acetyl-ADP-ribose deacetylase (regulator of RNase III)